jgi:hypothetical protein
MAGVIEHYRFIRESQGVWSPHQTTPITAPDIGIWNVVPAPRYAKTHTFYMQLWSSERNVYQE